MFIKNYSRYFSFFFKGLAVVLIICIFSEILLQLFLPQSFRIVEGGIVLPSNQVYKIKNKSNTTLDDEIIHTRNSLGLRGEELDSFSNIRIFTVGGSTTHCMYLSDQQEWTKILADLLKKKNGYIWVNNAGFSGQSTFGHIILTEKYLVNFHPKYIIYYIGINDMLRSKMADKDEDILLSEKGFKRIFYWSKLLMLLENIYTTKLLKYSFINTDEHKINYSNLNNIKRGKNYADTLNISVYTDNYKYRIGKIIDICKKHQVIPIFLTQASLFTCGYDNTNTLNLGRKTIEGDISVCAVNNLLDSFNNALIDVCNERNTLYVDMAKLVPKDTTYFYDFVHFTPEGAESFANILEYQIGTILSQ